MADFISDNIYFIAAVASMIMTVIIGLVTIKSSWAKSQKDRDQKFSTEIKTHLDEKVQEIRYRFDSNERSIAENKEDIEDVEEEVKQMRVDFAKICEKIQSHNFILDQLTPDFKNLKGEFYKFKGMVDSLRPSNIVFSKPENDTKTEDN